MRGNIHIIIGSLFFATLLWFSVTMNNQYQQVFRVPLIFTNLPEERALNSPLPENLFVTLKGSGWQLLFLRMKKSLRFEISGDQILRERYLVTSRFLPDAMNLPYGVDAVAAYPETLVVSYETYAHRKVPLIAQYDLRCRQGYGQVGPATLQPDSVEIRGAESIVRNLTGWRIVRQDFTDATSDISVAAPLADSLQSLVHLSARKTQLTIPVQQLADVEFHPVPVTVTGVPAAHQVLLSPSAVSVFVRGGIQNLSRVGAQDFRAAVDYATLLQDTLGEVVPQVEIPQGLMLLRVTPERIRFTIRR